MTRPPRRRRRVRVSRRGVAVRGNAIVLLGLLPLLFVALLQTKGPGGGPRDVVVPPGVGVGRIGGILASAGAVRSSLTFVFAAEITGSAWKLKAGEYEFPGATSVWRVADMIARGQVVRRAVTIPEGMTSKAASAVLDANPFLSGRAPIAPEGSLLPDTYDVKLGETRADVVRRMNAARDRVLDHLWAARAAGLPYANPEQAVTLASIVEKETAKPSERPRIAAIFVHRLQKGMRLESDPTTIYGLTGGVPLGHGLRVSELAGDTPYNTYRITGLPPTPIANPGRASLEAALHPAPGGDLYFVADGTGGHVFASTYAEHLRNVAKWRAIEAARR